MPVKKFVFNTAQLFVFIVFDVLIAGLAEPSSDKDYPLDSSYPAQRTATQFTD